MELEQEFPKGSTSLSHSISKSFRSLSGQHKNLLLVLGRNCLRPVPGPRRFCTGWGGMAAIFWPWPPGLHRCPDAPARPEDSFHHGPLGFGGTHHVVKNSIDDVLLKDAEVAVFGEILFERLQ